jgi:hypothetical protein
VGTNSERTKIARPGEAEAVRTTIVGGRPPGGGANVGDVPRSVEVLIKKAAVDPAFKKMLLQKRAEAADAIALKLEPAEAAMLNAVPVRQLKAIVANTKVRPSLRPAFLGYAAGVMLAALGAATASCAATFGNQPDRPEEPPAGPPGIFDPSENGTKQRETGDEPLTRGIKPDRP